ncbi:uncharacterized protein TrAtP1_002528 [Trichoderma atroviride]|uniref:uncharacterized protein n=1 Tax=Hypocrea atroviridis TaxID=63577 RepID=UPI00331AA47A|nr:hypothetical protein TrAtP1_002528 [Trichoderma atroviride]
MEILFETATGSSPASQSGSPNTSNTSATSLGPNTTLNLAAGTSGFVDSAQRIPREEVMPGQPPFESCINATGSNTCTPDDSPAFHLMANPGTISPTDPGFTGGNAFQNMKSLVDSSSPSSCSCPLTALDIWEILIINIASKKGATESFAQCQKAAISSCEALIRCHGCCSRPQNVMLLIDICAKLLESLVSQYGELSSCRRQSNLRPAACAHPIEDWTAANHGDDDENHVLKSLWMARMQRLGRLMAGVGALLDGEGWLIHRGLLQGVQVRFTSVMFGWSC